MSKHREFIHNDDLFPTPQDAEIAHLKYVIAKFKEYDKKRTEDYHRVYKDLDWYKEELRQKNEEIDSLRKEIGELKAK